VPSADTAWAGSSPASPWTEAGSEGDVRTIRGYYGPDPAHLFVLHERSDLPAEPLVIWIHGGGWSGGFYEPVPESIRSMNQLGFAVASIEIRSGMVHPAEVQDVIGALAYFLGTDLPLDGRNPILAGFSSGGHLAALAATAPAPAFRPYDDVVPNPPRAVVAIAAPTDLRSFFDDVGAPANGAVREYVGSACEFPATSSCIPLDASPVAFVSPGDPPLYLLYSNQDERVPPWTGQGDALAEPAAQSGVPLRLLYVDSDLVWDGTTSSHHNGTVDEFDPDDLLDWLGSLDLRAVDDEAVTNVDVPVVVDVLDNDLGGRGSRRIAYPGQPDRGAVTCTAVSCTYTPATGMVGRATFAYVLADEAGNTSIGTVRVDVTEPPTTEPPTTEPPTTEPPPGGGPG
jgi:acetyl esterase/lipase